MDILRKKEIGMDKNTSQRTEIIPFPTLFIYFLFFCTHTLKATTQEPACIILQAKKGVGHEIIARIRHAHMELSS